MDPPETRVAYGKFTLTAAHHICSIAKYSATYIINVSVNTKLTRKQ